MNALGSIKPNARPFYQKYSAAELKEALNVPIEGPHPEDTFLLESLEETGAKYGMEARPVMPDRWLKDFAEIAIKDEVRPLILKENARRILKM